MTNRLFNKILSLLLAVIIAASLFPISAFAEEVADSGDTGEAVTETVEDQTEPPAETEQPVEEEPDTTPPPATDTDKTDEAQDIEKEPEQKPEQKEEWLGIEWLDKEPLQEEWIGVIPDQTVTVEDGTKTDPKTGSNSAADVETAADWEKTIPTSKLNGTKAHDLITVALSQLGYHESTKNYVLNERGKHKGYSRYGQWYGIPYGDWCAMFVSFCLNYAGIKTSSFPRSASCTSWMAALKSMKKLAPAGYEPKAGDLVFFKFWTSSGSDHVGIVYDLYTDANGVRRIKVIEGNSSDRVQILTYPLSSSRIAGYGLLTDTFGPDFSSKRLLVVTTDPAILTKGEIIGEYGSAYLLDFESTKAAETAYNYYTEKADAAAPDIQLSQNTESDSAEAEANPLTVLNDLFQANAEAVFEQALNNPDSLEQPVDDRPIIALIDTAVNDPDIEKYSVINPEVNQPAEEPEEEIVKPSEEASTEEPIERGDETAPDITEFGEIEEIVKTHGDDMLSFIREENSDARIISIETLDENGKADVTAVYAAMRLAMNKGAKIINLSMSAYSTETNAVLKSIIDDASALGITVVVSAGNSGKNVKFYTPANVESAVTIGSCGLNGNPISKSNYGSGVDYYVVSDSTSEAAARFSGIISTSDALPDYTDTIKPLLNDRLFTDKIIEDDTVPPIPNENEDDQETETEDGTFTVAYPQFNSTDIAHGTCGTCSWLIDKDGNMVIWPTSGDAGQLANITNSAENPWNNYRNSIRTLRFEGSVKTERGCVRLFGSCPNLETIDFNSFDMSNAGNISYMFEGDTKLKVIDMSMCNCCSPYNLQSLFNDCMSLETIEYPMVSGNPHKPGMTMQSGNMSNVFGACSNLKSVNISGFQTDNVSDFNSLFNGCPNLEYLDISNMNNSGLQYVSTMLSGLKSLKELKMSGFTAPKVTNLSSLLLNCTELEKADLSNMPNAGVTNMSSMFDGCTKLTELNMTGFATPNVTDLSYMFRGCEALLGTSYDDTDEFGDPITSWKLDLSGFNTANVTTMANMFENCLSVTDIDLSSFSTNKCIDFSRMFRFCKSLKELDISNFTTVKNNRNNVNMYNMFQYCYGLVKLDMSNENFYMAETGRNGSYSSPYWYNVEFVFNTSLEEIKIGSGANFVSKSENDFVTLPDGLWQHQESGRIVTGVELSYEMWHRLFPTGHQNSFVGIEKRIQIMSEYAGTYKKIYPISPGLDDIPDVNIQIAALNTILPTFSQKGTKFEFTKRSGQDFQVTTSTTVPNTSKDYVYSTDADSFTLTYPDAATSMYGDKYDVVITFNSTRFYDVDVADPKQWIIAGGDRGLRLSGSSVDSISANIDLAYDVTVKLVNRSPEAAAAKNEWNRTHPTEQVDDSVVWEKDTAGNYMNPLAGTYLFGSYDLDVASKRKYTNADSSSDKHNKYSEGFYLGDGFYFGDNPDPTHNEPIVVSDNTCIYHTYVKPDGTSVDYHGNRINDSEFLGKYEIHGTRSDHESMSSGFIAKADAASSSFTWTSTRTANTTVFAAFSLKLFEVEKISPDGQRLEGATFKIQKGKIDPATGNITYFDLQKLDSSWNTSDNPHRVALVPGEYKLVELTAPKYYKSIDPISFSISTNSELVRAGQGIVDDLVVKDPLDKSMIQIAKHDQGDPTKTLSGMTFRLTGTSDDGESIDITSTSGDDGICSFNEIPVGTYTLTETAAPKGYKLPTEPWTAKVYEYDFTEIIDSQGNVSKGTFSDFVHGLFSLANEKENYSLTVKKTVRYGIPDGVDTFDFTLTLTDANGDPYTLPADIVDSLGSAVSFDAASGAYRLKVKAESEGVTIPLPEDTKYTLVENPSPYYTGFQVTKKVGTTSTTQNSNNPITDTIKYDSHEILYTNIPQVVSVDVSKEWDDKGVQGLTIPAGVTVHLQANGQDTGKFAILTEANGWKHTFTDLLKFVDGKAVEYTVEEAEVTGWSAIVQKTAPQSSTTGSVSYTEENGGAVLRGGESGKNNRGGGFMDGLAQETIKLNVNRLSTASQGMVQGVDYTLETDHPELWAMEKTESDGSQEAVMGVAYTQNIPVTQEGQFLSVPGYVSLRFKDAATLSDGTAADVIITYDDIVFRNCDCWSWTNAVSQDQMKARTAYKATEVTEHVQLFTGRGLRVRHPFTVTRESDGNQVYYMCLSMGCDVNVRVVFADGSPVPEGETFLFAITDLDTTDFVNNPSLTSTPADIGSGGTIFANTDERYNAHTGHTGGDTWQPTAQYPNGDFRESVWDLQGAVSKAYVPAQQYDLAMYTPFPNMTIYGTADENGLPNGLSFVGTHTDSTYKTASKTSTDSNGSYDSGFAVLGDAHSGISFHWTGQGYKMGSTMFSNSVRDYRQAVRITNVPTTQITILKDTPTDSANTDEFEFTVTFTNEDGTRYLLTRAALNANPNLTYNAGLFNYTLKLRRGESITLSIPHGVRYSVSESPLTGYSPRVSVTEGGTTTSSPSDSASGVLGANSVTVEFDNYRYTDITVNKSWIDASNANNFRPDDLTVHLQRSDSAGVIETKEYTTGDGEWSGWIKSGDGWTGTFHIPDYGDGMVYKVWEDEPAGYKGNYISLANSATVGSSKSVTLENKLLYELSIKKIVFDEGGVFRSKKFDFTLTLKNADGTPYLDQITPPAAATDWTDKSNGVYSFKLGHDETITIPLPIQTIYSVSEASPEGFNTDWELTYTEGGTVMQVKEKSLTVGEHQLMSDHSVIYNNLTYEKLPDAGGLGGIPIPAVILALSLFALLIVWYVKKRWVTDG